ncbi:1ec8cfd3-4f7b-49aa-a85e-3e79e75486b8 [Thermothielavioides terrestris]|uniref:1ec8cfd3-4f7b-49aa-a85e-3e79e75486b8 n=1 Tax=Thermothielavioides terrestris TaxID=2587410 RepID=A0A446BE63_9PEZI|nr:1ec8cfd3-4f7b-49aa-a85e-3e79e75486b8 [Thermothielavioides terrestris]
MTLKRYPDPSEGKNRRDTNDEAESGKVPAENSLPIEDSEGSREAHNRGLGCGPRWPENKVIQHIFDGKGNIRSDKELGSLSIRMVPNLNGRLVDDCREAAWMVDLLVGCADIARLMREGFFWSAADVLPEQGRIAKRLPAEWADSGFRHCRVWILMDRSHGDAPQWVASLELFARSFELLPRFRLQDLSPQNICEAVAWVPSGDVVYNYDCRSPGRNCNCIYDGMPLQGWWPWPKDEGACVAEVPQHARDADELAFPGPPLPEDDDETVKSWGCVIL